MSRYLLSSLFMLTTFPVALVGLGAGLAVGTSAGAVVAITVAWVVAGLLSFFAAMAGGGPTLPPRMRRAGLVFLPLALLLGVALGVTYDAVSGFFFGGIAVALALYQIAGFGLLDRWLHRRYGDCVVLSPESDSA